MASSLAKYLAGQIKKGNLTYEQVIAKYPELKDEIDAIFHKK